jgi:hypothetical protein
MRAESKQFVSSNPGIDPHTSKNALIDGLLYFAYGSNLHLPQLRERAPSAKPVGVGRLTDHRLAFTRQSTRWDGLAADILSTPGSSVFGAVVSISRDDLDGLDRSEYLGVGYRRIRVFPRLGIPSGPVGAFTYEVIDKQSEGKPPSDYLATILIGARELGLPPAWIGFLEGFA